MFVQEICSSLASFRTETLPLSSARALTFLIAPGVRTMRERPDEYASSIETVSIILHHLLIVSNDNPPAKS